MKVKLRYDHNCDMFEIYKDGSCIFCGNFWDFSIHRELPNILKEVGAEVKTEEFDWEEDNE